MQRKPAVEANNPPPHAFATKGTPYVILFVAHLFGALKMPQKPLTAAQWRGGWWKHHFPANRQALLQSVYLVNAIKNKTQGRVEI